MLPQHFFLNFDKIDMEDINATIEQLNGAVNTLQTKLCTNLQKMTSSLAVSAETLMSMNNMMEELVIQSFQFSHRFIHLESNLWCFKVYINTTAIPMGSVSVESTSPSSNVKIEREGKYLFDNITIERNPREFAWKITTRSDVSEPFDLVLDLSFPSPGSGKILQRKEHFSISLLDLCDVKIFKSSVQDEFNLSKDELKLEASTFRDVFRIPPHQGIEVAHCYELINLGEPIARFIVKEINTTGFLVLQYTIINLEYKSIIVELQAMKNDNKIINKNDM